MNEYFISLIKTTTQANKVIELEMIQELWSGYGQIVRFGLEGAAQKTVVVKHVCLPEKDKHPRAWNTNISHQRKLKSYQVESNWYTNYSKFCSEKCRIPNCLAIENQGQEMLMVLEDLDANGFPHRKHSVTWEEMKACLRWFANFHAVFMQTEPKSLWEIGTYWHLETRPDELAALEDQSLKQIAVVLDQKLKETKYKTLVHGDAKLANFCFSENGKSVAAVDFQYVGGGCGMKDLAYFVGSCLDEEACEKLESKILQVYFSEVEKALVQQNSEINFEELEYEWRALYPLAWTDFHRFLKGWSPEHWKINDYSERIAKEVVEKLQNKI